MAQPVVQVENLSKQYRIGGQQEKYGSLRESLTNTFSSTINRFKNGQFRTQPETIWALKDVSFEVKQGEVVGIIGRNGAGKSTLLKILSRITKPTEGTVRLRGRVGSLLEVGTGFHPELTGRENIYLNGAILGMSRVEIDRKFDEIVDFSEIEKFLDTPVKRYSSGMYVRLAFAVAAHLETEILLVDEVLAVGDLAFQRKCLGKMGEVSRGGRTVLFVSHNLGTIQSLCRQALLLSEGRLMLRGDTQSVIFKYVASFSEEGKTMHLSEIKPGLLMQIIEVSIQNHSGNQSSHFDISDDLYVSICYQVRETLTGSAISLKIVKDGIVLSTLFDTDDLGHYLEVRNPGSYWTKITFPAKILKPGQYFIHVGAGILNQKRIDYVENAISFSIDVVSTGDSFKSFASKRDGLVSIPAKWEILSLDENLHVGYHKQDKKKS